MTTLPSNIVTGHIYYPEEISDSATLCIFGDSKAVSRFRLFPTVNKGKTPLTFLHNPKPKDYRHCDIVTLFDRTIDVVPIVQWFRGKEVLTIGNTENFHALGGIVKLFPDGQSMKISINLKRAKSAGYGFSARLLQLAKIFED